MNAGVSKVSKADETSRPDLPQILFIDKVFLKSRGDMPLRGVEVFNLNLVGDLIDLGYPVTMLVTGSWYPAITDVLASPPPRFLHVPDTRIDALNALAGAVGIRRNHHRFLLLANVGKGLMPMIRLLRHGKRFDQAVLIAHREATPKFVRLMRSLPGHVLAVNDLIARPFRDSGHPSVQVDYGVVNAHLFHPAEKRMPGADGLVHFCVLGMLDNAWKGADTAVDAFRRLPGQVREKCRLHLASYTHPPSFPEPEVQAYPWMAPDDVPDFLRRMDVMVVPSRDEQVMRETFSQAVVQGMLTGLPVLVSDLPVLKEKVDQGGGFVCATARDLANGMEQLATDARRRHQLGQEAREIALKRYVWDTRRFASRYLGLGGC